MADCLTIRAHVRYKISMASPSQTMEIMSDEMATILRPKTLASHRRDILERADKS